MGGFFKDLCQFIGEGDGEVLAVLAFFISFELTNHSL